MSETALIRVSKGTWKNLNDLKQKPADTFNDVIMKLLEYWWKHKDEGKPFV